MLDNRLKMCAEMVSGKGIACDVGTDHAYLAADLVMSGKCGRVIASDVKEGPLDSARNTVMKFGLADKVDLVMSDGLENIDLNGVTDIVIAGMGGETIIDILSDSAINDHSIRLILQPMSKPELLRKWLYKHGFRIIIEKAAEADYKLYTVIQAELSHEKRDLTEYESIAGFFGDDDAMGKRYRQKESDRLAKVGTSLKNNGMIIESTHCFAMSQRLIAKNGDYSMDVREIYNFFDEMYPFNIQEKWDNSGLLLESESMACSKVLLSLDITLKAAEEAINKGAELVISHHPVIFDPLHRIANSDPVFHLIRNNIAAICMHTNLDIAEGGTNTAIVKRLGEKLEFSGSVQQFQKLDSDNSLGCIVELAEPIDIDEFSQILKGIFGSAQIIVNTYGKSRILKIAICSGSGGSLLDLAIAKNCDALITGDVKHNVWIDANNRQFTVFDCGHFHTENIVLPELRRVLEERFPLLDVEIADSSVDPCKYY